MNIFSFLVLTLLATLVQARRLIQASEPVPGSYIVVFHDNVTDIRAAVKTMIASMPGSSVQHIFKYALKGFAFRTGPLEAKSIPHVLASDAVDYVAQVS
jgi:hypothetical protein